MELQNSPHPESKGMGADGAKYLQAVSIAQQTGKTVEEVLAFMGLTGSPVGSQTTAVSVTLPKELQNATLPLPVMTEAEAGAENAKSVAKSLAPKQKEPVEDVNGFVITEVIDQSEATEADLAKLSEQEEENNWDEHIRVGSTVRIIYQVAASKVNFVGKKGKVTRVIGNEAAKVYEVEFSGKKVPHIQLNKKTGKLERGYKNKSLKNTFSEDQVELAH